jgi:protein-S-isoprenylcysteine O-methyltransferase Ste14
MSSEPPTAEVPASEVPHLLHSKWLLACGNVLFHLRNGLFPVIFVLLLLVFRPSGFSGHPSADTAIMGAGAVIALTGQFIRLFVIGYAYIRRGGKNRQIYADDLVTAGLYAHSRNPMYVGNFLLACGFCLYYGSAWMCAIAIPFFGFVYLAITAAEEQYLYGKFGTQYEAYMREVHRFVPDLRGISQSLGGHRFRWREVLAKEYGTLFSTLSGLTIIAMWKLDYLYGWEASRARILATAWLFLPWLAFYVLVRFMKVTGRLKEPVSKPSTAAAI